MKTFLVIILIMLMSNIYGQKTYNSSVTTNYESKGEVVEKNRTITISEKKITITNLLDGGTKTLNLKVNAIKEKKDYWDGQMIWYYCICTEKDVITGEIFEYLVIMKKSNPTNISVCQKLDEVTFIKTVFSLR